MKPEPELTQKKPKNPKRPNPDYQMSFGKNNPRNSIKMPKNEVPQTARTSGASSNNPDPVENRRPKTDRTKKGGKSKPLGTFRPTPLSGPQKFRLDQQAEQPICVLKIELDGGENTQIIKVFKNQKPEEIVNEFGDRFNLSQNARDRLLEQVLQQIEEETGEPYQY